MRMLVLAVIVMLISLPAMAQDAAMQASQAAMQASQIANDAIMQASQQSMQSAFLASQQNSGCLTPTPRVSLKAGKYTATQTVLLSDRSRRAVIFYTTDGWTPTLNSARFSGPITVDRSFRLQAVAFLPGCSRSRIAAAEYELPQTQGSTDTVIAANDRLRAGTPIALKFANEVSSHHAKVGDSIVLNLAEPVTLNSRIFAPGSATASGVLTAVHRKGLLFRSASEMTFVVTSLNLDGLAVPLSGERTAKAPDTRESSANSNVVEARGRDVVIAAGATVVADVKADTRFGTP